METLEGYVDRIVFRNEENGYTVMEVAAGQEEVTCFGNAVYIHQGEYVKVTGEYVLHPVYGQQLKIQEIELQAPKDQAAMERYLASGAVKGIGLALAARVVRKFGDDTYRILEEEPERLAEVNGISARKARDIADQLEKQRDLRKAMLFLQQYGISVNLAVKIYQKYENHLYEIIRENPYRMAEDIPGVGFRMADEIASKAGVLQDSQFRISCGLVYLLRQASVEGHTCLPKQLLFLRAKELLSVGEEQLEQPMMNLLIERKIICKEMEEESFSAKGDVTSGTDVGMNALENRRSRCQCAGVTSGADVGMNTQQTITMVYESRTYYTELYVARRLRELNITFPADEKDLEAFFRKKEKEELQLDDLQKQAVTAAMKNGVFVLTGGPGTGKTTTINMMIRYFLNQKMQFRLAAPTGRAAKRMTEATGYEAQTIHRLLELSGEAFSDKNAGENFSGERERMTFGHDDSNPLETDVIIIDEMSMVDIFLMEALLKAVATGTRLILVGDVNQLPSVGPGCVLKDLILSECFPVVRLTHIFRQAAESDIVMNAHHINHGEALRLDNKSRDFFFLQRLDPDVILQSIIYLVEKKLPPYVEAKPFDIQVLAPMRKGALGVENLNIVLQKALNPPAPGKTEKEHKNGIFRCGDKVMQIRNNYQLEWEIRNKYGILADNGVGVFNGDMGIITEIDSDSETMTVLFDECREVLYPFMLLDELDLAYAVTIHKSQGSEYPAVVIPLLSGPRMLFNRNLLYTAVTRAKRCVTMIGSKETVQKMIENTSEQKRYCGLRQRLAEAL